MRASGSTSLRADRRESLPNRFMASHSTFFLSGKRSTRFSLPVRFMAPDTNTGANATEKKKGPRWRVDRFVVIA
ncbi:hypothetical protein ABZ851_16780 [Streptomyces sp. NPDC047049]|uniref:hypothetical protein n=1 Tax=Streptomyces sp. NPDC047049 TaxID=3156688 RepID=UPI0033EA0B3A